MRMLFRTLSTVKYNNKLLTSKESLSTVNVSATFHLSQVTVNQGLNHSAERLRGGERGGGGRKGDVY